MNRLKITDYYLMDKNHVMLDLETLSLKPNAVILSIGATAVGREQDGFYRKLGTFYFPVGGFDIDRNTLAWWNEQSPEAKAEAFSGKADIKEVLHEFRDWFPADAIIWANGAAFDIPVLTYAYGYFGMQVPWNYKNVACYRTLANLFDCSNYQEPEGRETVAHISIADAKWQAHKLEWILRRM
jgi:DNA polymerase III alpha subunit (gram-positive type)